VRRRCGLGTVPAFAIEGIGDGRRSWVEPASFPGGGPVEDALNGAETLGQPYVGTAGITIPTGIVEGVGEPQTADRYRDLRAH
jgi:hypothetical protein